MIFHHYSMDFLLLWNKFSKFQNIARIARKCYNKSVIMTEMLSVRIRSGFTADYIKLTKKSYIYSQKINTFYYKKLELGTYAY